ncbi:MAG: alpha/beta fold hydrolase [Spirochaetaceae bacterium]
MLHYQQIGHGVPLVILHGLFGSGDNWRSLAGDFSARARVILVDMPNHGSSPHTDDMHYEAMAAAVRELLEELGLEPAVLLGHSMGGKVAMALALSSPALIRGLVVADIAPRSYSPRHGEIIAAMQEVAAAAPSSRREAEEILAERVPGKAVRSFLLKSLKPAGDGGYRWALNIDAIAGCYEHLTSWPEIEGRYDGPTLFIAGGTSDYVGPEDTDAIRHLFPHAVLKRIGNAGHWLHVEQREAFTELVLSFLSENA